MLGRKNRLNKVRGDLSKYRHSTRQITEQSGINLTESEERQLMLRLEELASIEGLRTDKFVRKIPAVTQAEMDAKADASQVFIHDEETYISKDASGNLTLTDAIAGTRILKNLGCPTLKYIKALNQSEGDLHLSDVNTWDVSKAMICEIRVVTSSTDWDMWILQNDNGYTVDDANIPKQQIMESGNAGDNSISFPGGRPYEDEDVSNEVHLYFADNSGSNTVDIYILGFEMV